LIVGFALTFQKLKFFEIKLPNSVRLSSAGLVLIIGVYALSAPMRMYLADLLVAGARNRGQGLSAIAKYQQALETFPATNPFYLAELAFTPSGLFRNR